MPWPITGDTHYHAKLGLPDKGRVIKGLVVWYVVPHYPIDSYRYTDSHIVIYKKVIRNRESKVYIAIEFW